MGEGVRSNVWVEGVQSNWGGGGGGGVRSNGWVEGVESNGWGK